MIEKRVFCVAIISIIVVTLCCGSEESSPMPNSPDMSAVDQADESKKGEGGYSPETSEEVVVIEPVEEQANAKTLEADKSPKKVALGSGSSDKENSPEKKLLDKLDKEDVALDKVPSAVLLSEQENLTTVAVVKILKPSVVQIAASNISPGSYNQAIPRGGVGSGVILDKEGRILTNNHVALGGPSLRVTLADGRTYPAKIVGNDPRTDLAVIQINAAKLNPARLGISADLQVGEDVIAVGHALGLKGGATVSKGVISALERTIEVSPQMSMVDLIQTDASINPGNSGGPLANVQGEVIGINTAIIEGSNGIGFAINIDDAKTVVDQLIQYGEVKRGFIGISPFDVTDSLRQQLKLPVSDGVIVARVIQGYPAEKAGIEVNDVIVMLGKTPILNTGDLSKYLIENRSGEEISVQFYREGKLLTVYLTLVDMQD